MYVRFIWFALSLLSCQANFFIASGTKTLNAPKVPFLTQAPLFLAFN